MHRDTGKSDKQQHWTAVVLLEGMPGFAFCTRLGATSGCSPQAEERRGVTQIQPVRPWAYMRRIVRFARISGNIAPKR